MDRKSLRRKTAVFAAICVFAALFLFLFGGGYAVVCVNVAAAALMMLSRDLSVRPFANLGSIMALMVFMGVGAFVASLDPFLGLAVNFAVVLAVVFLCMQDLRSPMHFPMLMFYATMVTMPITVVELPDRLLILAFSAAFIVALNVMVNRGSRSRTSHEGVVAMCEEIRSCSASVLAGGSPDHAEVDRLASDVGRGMYDRLKSHFFTTPGDRTVLDLVVSLADLGRVVCRGRWSEDALRGLDSFLDAVVAHERGAVPASEVAAAAESYISSQPGTAPGTELILRDIVRELVSLESGVGGTYGGGRRPRASDIVGALREEARRDSARFTFSVRMALMFALTAFAWDYWSWENAQVLLFTVTAVIVPYLEDSVRMSLMRLSGTALGALAFAAAVLVSGDSDIALLAVAMSAAYLYVVFDDAGYDRKMFFFTLIVMVASAMTAPATEASMVTDRIGFTVAGIAVGAVANRVVLPYRIRDENAELAVRSLRISLERIRNIRDLLDGRPDAEEEAGLAVTSASISQKMLINADRGGGELARKFQMRQDSLSIQCSSLYKAVPGMSGRCREAVRDVMSADPDAEGNPGPADVSRLDPYETECVRRAEGVMATYRRNRRLMYDLIVSGYLDDGPVATLRTRRRRRLE